jgi:hypothetical protein
MHLDKINGLFIAMALTIVAMFAAMVMATDLNFVLYYLASGVFVLALLYYFQMEVAKHERVMGVTGVTGAKRKASKSGLFVKRTVLEFKKISLRHLFYVLIAALLALGFLDIRTGFIEVSMFTILLGLFLGLFEEFKKCKKILFVMIGSVMFLVIGMALMGFNGLTMLPQADQAVAIINTVGLGVTGMGLFVMFSSFLIVVEKIFCIVFDHRQKKLSCL